jgi:hypothetical protein
MEKMQLIIRDIRELCLRDRFMKVLAKWIRIISAAIIVVLEICDILMVSIRFPQMLYVFFNKCIKEILDTKITFFLFGWIIFLIVDKGLKYVCIMVDKSKKSIFIPILLTIEDFIDVICATCFLLYSISEALWRNNNNETAYIKWIALVYLIYICFRFVYIKNNKLWQKKQRSHTYYFDITGKNIREHDIVVYYGKGYTVQENRNIAQQNGKIDRLEQCIWNITPINYRGKEISLENAVADKEGNLTIIDNY